MTREELFARFARFPDRLLSDKELEDATQPDINITTVVRLNSISFIPILEFSGYITLNSNDDEFYDFIRILKKYSNK